MPFNIRKIDVDSLDQPNAPPPADVAGMPNQDIVRAFPPVRRSSASARLPLVQVGLALGLAGGLVLGAWKLVGYLGAVNAGDYGTGLDFWLLTVLKLALALGAVAGVGLLVLRGLVWVLGSQVVQLQNGQPVSSLDIAMGWTRPGARDMAAWGLGLFHQERSVWAEHSGSRAMGTYAPTFQNATPAPGGFGLAQGVQLALPGGPDIGPLPADRWLDWVDSQPHVMLGAKTGGGKSVTARAILRRRIDRGHQVLVIDPHYTPGNWWDLPGVGGAEDWVEVAQAMTSVLLEYGDRLVRHKGGQRTFQPMTVLFDEVFLAKFNYDQLYGPKDPDHPFRKFAAVLGSGARKVGISVILMTQSTNVEDLGVSGPLRENFSRLALDQRTIGQMIDRDELDPDRRKSLSLSLSAQGAFPATAEMSGQVYFLDRSGLVDLGRPARTLAALWPGWEWSPDQLVDQGGGLLEDLLAAQATGSTVSTGTGATVNLGPSGGFPGEPVEPVAAVPADLEALAAQARAGGLDLSSRDALVGFLAALGLSGNQVDSLVAGKRAEVLRSFQSYASRKK
jgi:hypothetical protein